MKNQKNSRDLIRQNEVNTKTSQKHEANLQKNSTLYFQVGLIVCLLFSYGLLEMEFKSQTFVPEVAHVINEPLDYVQDNFKIYEEPIEKVEKQRKKPTFFSEPEVHKNDEPIDETPDIITEPETTSITQNEPNFDNLIDEPEEIDDVHFNRVEIAPIFPGCEKASTNDERKACMSEKISKHIRKKFDTDVAQGLGLDGVQKINVMFKIDQNGNVIDIKARSPFKALEKEAIDVISKLPKMTPGKQKDKNVSVIYGIPIRFNVQN
ncbi:energy transducer TonB [Lacinutrix iliipiscaria]|uniref:Energy transducer TonB n=1 Tax=Lacinutrix iliipiscaria TaxID=1230532 RepID=A0ABW5WHK7_9FLAO